MRRSLLRLLGLGLFNIPGAGGQTPPRPDQQYPAPPIPPVAPGSTNIVRARQVIVFGPGDGVFIYNGTPALGNPPVLYMTGGTVDPFGNTLPATGIVAMGGSGEYSQMFSGSVNIEAGGAFAPAGMSSFGAGGLLVSSGGVTNVDSQASVLLQSADNEGGTSTIGLSAANVEVTQNMQVSGTLVLVNPILVTGTSATAGLPNGGISGTSGAASAGTAHTHGPGSFSVTNGVHSHGAGTYEVS